MFSRPLPPSTRRPLVWVLACALLLAQTLGLAHRVLHVEGPHAGALELGHDPAHGQDASPSTSFGHHEGASDCRLFDHLASGDALPCAVPMPTVASLPTRCAALPETPATATDTPVFQARAPPALA